MCLMTSQGVLQGILGLVVTAGIFVFWLLRPEFPARVTACDVTMRTANLNARIED